jgi:hypothetical protein
MFDPEIYDSALFKIVEKVGSIAALAEILGVSRQVVYTWSGHAVSLLGKQSSLNSCTARRAKSLSILKCAPFLAPVTFRTTRCQPTYRAFNIAKTC